MKVAQPDLLGEASFRRLIASPAARREIAAAYIAHAEQGLSYLGWRAAIARAYPEHVHPYGTAMQVAADVGRSLGLAEALLSPLARKGIQDLRRVPVARRSNFSRGPTGTRRPRPKADPRS